MTLDRGSIFFAAGCICLVNAMFVLLSWRGGRQYDGMGPLRLGLVLMGFFFFWQMTRAWIPEGLVVGLSQPAVVGGLALIYDGFSRLTGKRPFLPKAAALAVITLLALAYFLFVVPSLAFRFFVTSLWLAVIAILFIHHLSTDPGALCRPATRGILIAAVALFGGAAAATTYHLAFEFGLRNDLELNAPSLTVGIGYLAALLSMSFYGMMALQLVSERAQADLDQAQARLAGDLVRERELAATQRAFVAMASHQFRNPLATIDLSAHTIQRRVQGPEDDPRLIESAGRIRRTVARMVALMDTMLGAASASDGRIEMTIAPVDLALLITGAVDRAREIAPGRRFDLDLAHLPAAVEGDHDLLEQVFANLLSNAIKYSPKDKPIGVTGRIDGDAATVAVADEGPGIAAEDQAAIFERFIRGSNVKGHSGTGVGLTLARYLVDLHRGTITVASEIGRGATFTVRLPIRQADR